ncbi:sugar ABC transporter ATP-binding protein [Mycolicibacterium stellerae]|uniref:sugar ABC transporter ATP-binding protein n=1 Tax=Mycolicibacterium stellerae TaxID=2358193 RepID=UPI000F0B7387|nr:sugar ABC transporter ATP-binding protein [Mycolicibacterium stellerae]
MTKSAAPDTDTGAPVTGADPRVHFGVRGATHDYSGVVVLRNVDFDISGGNIHALVGENGSGKSTLIKVLSGVAKPTSGTIVLDGQAVSWATPQSAQAAGIAVVHQNYNLFPDMSVEHNLLAGAVRPPRSARTLGAVDHSRWREHVRRLLDRLGVDLDPRSLVGSLGAAQRKFVEIARAMLLEPRFLILDEPTAALEPAAAQQVLNLMRTLRGQGLGLAFVSHRLDEVVQTADQVTVLRDGARVEHRPLAATSARQLATMMIGDRAVAQSRRPTAKRDDVLMRLRGLRVVDGVDGIDLDVHAGEIVAVTGLLGSGAATVVAMVGGDVPLSGHCEIAGSPASIRSVRDAQKLGIGLIPEDRKARGLVIAQSCAFNISLASFGRVARAGFLLSRRRLIRRAQDYRDQLDIKWAGPHASAATLSGGNQQKVMLAKLLASNVRVMAVEEPTQGVDIGGRAQIHDLLREFVANGNAVIVYSTDLAEALALADRVGVFRHGALAHMLPTAELTEHQLAALVVGDRMGDDGSTPGSRVHPVSVSHGGES